MNTPPRSGRRWIEGECGLCRSGLVSRKGREAAPAIFVAKLKSWGCFAPLSRHKAAPAKPAQYAGQPTIGQALAELNAGRRVSLLARPQLSL
ncbi:hypothetical protein CQW31_10925 [Pseudomonas sp. 382]|nr:hypothetical protein DZC31_02095 [Stenotrophomonas rhizophila]PIK78742.1 hypothetical protein CQW31_10925 [Pseudomonas sp. 382]